MHLIMFVAPIGVFVYRFSASVDASARILFFSLFFSGSLVQFRVASHPVQPAAMSAALRTLTRSVSVVAKQQHAV